MFDSFCKTNNFIPKNIGALTVTVTGAARPDTTGGARQRPQLTLLLEVTEQDAKDPGAVCVALLSLMHRKPRSGKMPTLYDWVVRRAFGRLIGQAALSKLGAGCWI